MEEIIVFAIFCGIGLFALGLGLLYYMYQSFRSIQVSVNNIV